MEISFTRKRELRSILIVCNEIQDVLRTERIELVFYVRNSILERLEHVIIIEDTQGDADSDHYTHGHCDFWPGGFSQLRIITEAHIPIYEYYFK